MSTGHQTQSFADTGLARLFALVLAVLIAIILWFNWSSDFRVLLENDDTAPQVSSSTLEPAKPVNAALEACLTQRVGDVDKMKEEGILSDAQYGAFKARAEGLCRAQNPGG